MPLLQCGFLANVPRPAGAGEPNNSHEIASAAPVPVSSAVQLGAPCPGGWGFALAAAGAVYCWGVNSATLLAKAGSNEDGADPADLEQVAPGVSAAAAGFDHGLLVQGGKVLVFGPAFRPAGAAPGLHLSPVPLKVAVVTVAAGAWPGGCWPWKRPGWWRCCMGTVVARDGHGATPARHPPCTCHARACPTAPQPPRPPLPTGEHHSLALAATGDVYAWGSNAEGQLGDGTTGGSSAAPLLVAGPGSGARDAGLLQPTTAIAAGARHSLAVNTSGQCLAWGWSLHGQCGTGSAVPPVPSPTLVGALGPLKCVAVAGGMGHTVVATDQGDVYAWGLNSDGQLGDGTDTAALQVSGRGFNRCAAGGGCCVSAGQAWVPLTQCSRCPPSLPTPQPKLVEDGALAGDSVVKVAAGARHTLALCASGKAYAWGWGAFGQLGSGAFASARSPQAVAVPGGAKVTDLAAGWWHSLFLTQ